MLKRLYLLTCFLVFAFASLAQDNSAIVTDEFEEFTSDSLVTTLSSPTFTTPHKRSSPVDIYWTLSVLFATVLAGVLIKFRATRQLRSLFLISSIVVLGFYRGGCPCSIQSFQNGILLITGNLVRWPSVLLFAGLLLVTYFFGRVYCGWVCQLGAIQEFIFKTSAIKLFQSERSQKIMRSIRITVLVVLISQLLITNTNLYKEIDPFAVIYNFYSNYFIGWALVFIIILSSFVLYRPFCKTICPVGLMLGWVSKIPGASVLGVKSNCFSCIQCSRSCRINAITHYSKISLVENQECIRCGECMNSCKINALSFYRKNRKHLSKIYCKPLPLTTM